MNKIILWLAGLFGNRKSLKILLPSEPKRTTPTSADLVSVLQKARQDAFDPPLSEELKTAIELNIGKIIAPHYRASLIKDTETILIHSNEIRNGGILYNRTGNEEFSVKKYIVTYLNSQGIKATLYLYGGDEFVHLNVSDVTAFLDTVPSNLDEPREVENSIGIYR